MTSEIKIVDESTDGDIHIQLYVDGCRRAFISNRGGSINLHWEVYGPQSWPEAKVLIQGLMDLSIIADSLSQDHRNG